MIMLFSSSKGMPYFVTLESIIKAKSALPPWYETIVQDEGVIRLIRRTFPPSPLTFYPNRAIVIVLLSAKHIFVLAMQRLIIM